MVERILGKDEVSSSNLDSSSIEKKPLESLRFRWFLYFRSFLPPGFLFAAQKGPPAPCGRAGGLCNMEEAGRCGMPRRGKLVDQLVMSRAVDGEPGLSAA